MSKLSRLLPAQLPLRTRLTLWYLVTLAAILIFFAAFLYWQVERSLTGQMDAALQLAATQARLSVRAGGEQLAFQTADEPDTGQQRLGDDFAVYLLASDGTLLDWVGIREEYEPRSLKGGLMTVRGEDDAWRVYSTYLSPGEIAPGSPAGWLQIAREMDDVTETLASLRAQLLLGLPLALLLAGIGGLFLARRALRPIEQITSTAQAINAGDLARRIEYRGPADEVGRLAATFDGMLARLQEAFERERRFTGDAAHELRTPLTAMKGRIEVTLNQPRTEADYAETLRGIATQVDRLIRLSNDLLFMARLDQTNGHVLKRDDVALDELLPAVVDQVKALAARNGIAISSAVPPDLTVLGDLDLMIRLFLNLLDNALKYTGPGGEVTLRARVAGEEAVIAIGDTGAGIPAEHLPHLFQRFYRVEDDRGRIGDEPGGTGLGLAIAAEIARLHGGTILVESKLGTGTTFTVRLPRYRAAGG